MTNTLKSRILQHLHFIYGNQIPERYADEIIAAIDRAHQKTASALPGEKWSQRDSVLITYADSIKKNGQKSLPVLHKFLKKRLKGVVSCLHILPFFPYSSDDGFSVIDYKKVNPNLGNWHDIENAGNDFDLMFDLVINHISRQSQWFEKFKQEKSPEKDFFIEAAPDADYSQVVRPRVSPLLTPVQTVSGTKYVWTTFSPDQIDLNFANPELLLEMIKIMLFYLSKGAHILRIDAIAFLWKKTGTSCLNLPETHQIVKLLRDIAEAAKPRAIILTETNVPHNQNISYFGNADEAHLVYNFSLPPLLLETFFSENSEILTNWAKSLPKLPPECSFFNFTASHDGIGVRPVEGILPKNRRDKLIEGMKKNGAHISSKTNTDGTQSPYEINITYFDALKTIASGESRMQTKRFIASQTLVMALQGIPAFYIHSFLATPNDAAGVKQTGRARSINRHKWNIDEVEKLLSQPDSPQSEVFAALSRRLKIRQKNPVFHPNSQQIVENAGDKIFALGRKSQTQMLYALTNISAQKAVLETTKLSNFGQAQKWRDLISGLEISGQEAKIELEPYQTLWLTKI